MHACASFPFTELAPPNECAINGATTIPVAVPARNLRRETRARVEIGLMRVNLNPLRRQALIYINRGKFEVLRRHANLFAAGSCKLSAKLGNKTAIREQTLAIDPAFWTAMHFERLPVESRRAFFKKSALAASAILTANSAFGARPENTELHSAPWYRRALRWGQTNITEADPARYDIAWWRSYWKRTRVQGVIINAGGIVAYYPSRYPLHHRALALGDRDLFGELTAAAHADGLAVFARMDSNRAHEAFFRARPEWFCRQKNGEPYRAGDQFIACINSGYFDEYLLQILREIIERSHPEGFTDNSWAGLGRGSICY